MTMAYRITLPALALGFLCAAAAWGQHQHHSTTAMMGVDPKDYDDGGGRGGDVNPPAGCSGVQARITIVGTSFSPSTVTVRPGEPVCWTWSQSVQHNVHADDDSFTSGAPASQGTFQTTFTAVGSHGFHCQVHGSTTGGMRGTVVVQDDSGGGGGGGGDESGPGTLSLSPTAYTVTEGTGALTVTVARVGGHDGKASVKFATSPGTAKANKDYTTRTGTLNWAPGDGDPKTFQIPVRNDNVPEPDKTFTVRLSKATGAALGDAVAAVTLHDDDNPGCGAAAAASDKLRLTDTFDGPTTPCDESRALCLADGRFEAAVQWHPSLAGGGRPSKRVLLPETPGSGFFSSSAQEEPELTVTVLDRCGVNGHHWLSLAAATDVEFTVRVRDTLTGRTRVYASPAGAMPSSLRDVEAFAGCP
jgi:plastocyanin